MKFIGRMPVVAWLLLVGSFMALLLYFTGNHAFAVVCFFAVPFSYLRRLLGPTPESKREEVGLALLMRPLAYLMVVIISFIIHLMAIYGYAYEWVQNRRRPKYLRR